MFNLKNLIWISLNTKFDAEFNQLKKVQKITQNVIGRKVVKSTTFYCNFFVDNYFAFFQGIQNQHPKFSFYKYSYDIFEEEFFLLLSALFDYLTITIYCTTVGHSLSCVCSWSLLITKY
jgi:hypothetical protein